MALTDVTNPVLGEMTLRVRPAKGGSDPVDFTRFLAYEYCENWLSPSDESSFEIAEKELSPADAAALQPGSVVQVVVNGNVQSVGVLDEPEATVDRSVGSVVRVRCRDQMSLAVDAQVDPRVRFKDTMTLLDVVAEVLGPLGFDSVLLGNASNRDAVTGIPSSSTSTTTKTYSVDLSTNGGTPAPGTVTVTKSQAVTIYEQAGKLITTGQCKPNFGEGAYEFVSRISQRFGLWVRASAFPGVAILSEPDFDQAPRYGLQHAYGSASLSNNIERGTFRKSRVQQPSILYASGFGGGGEFAKSKLRAGVVNPLVDADNSAIIGAYPDVKLIEVPAVTAAFPPIIEAKARPAFLHDPDSHTPDQLEAFLLRELSLRMRKALTARYEIMGHLLNAQAVAVDTIVNLNDQRPTVQWQGPLWILGRRFTKSANGGARTSMELLLPGSISFGPRLAKQAKPPKHGGGPQVVL